MDNPYNILGINQNATDDEVKSAYRKLVKKYHPDRYADNPLSDLANDKLQEINKAYEQIVSMRSGKYNGQQDDGNNQYNNQFNNPFNNSFNNPYNNNPYNGGRYYRNNSGCSGCDACTSLICADCLCECCGGDLISCC